jgi:hypothetical protein
MLTRHRLRKPCRYLKKPHFCHIFALNVYDISQLFSPWVVSQIWTRCVLTSPVTAPCTCNTNKTQDEYRLPEGVKRIGYDADTQRYTFCDKEGNLFESAPGSRYGELRPAGQVVPQATHYTPPENIEERTQLVEKDNRTAVRTMLPFALLVFVFLLLVFKATNGDFGGGPDKMRADDGVAQIMDCHDGSSQIQIEAGDTCWAIAQEHTVGVADLLALAGNEEVDCDRLSIGQGLCVPE